MRLCLRIFRHGLPATSLLWTVGNDIAATPETISIAQFLEKVDEIVPLESDDWGLEDYTVEVHGFECLHFQDVNTVLRDGDEV